MRNIKSKIRSCSLPQIIFNYCLIIIIINAYYNYVINS